MHMTTRGQFSLTTRRAMTRWLRCGLLAIGAGLGLGLAGCETVVDAGRSALGASAVVTIPAPQQLPPIESAGGNALLGGREFTVNAAEEPWGAGYLNAPRRALTRVNVPLFVEPRGAQWGWFVEGRGYDAAQNVAPPTRPDMWLRLVNGEQALIVTQEARGGWIELRWGEPTDARGGLAWTTIALARDSGLIYTPWSTAFIGGGGLVFRNPEQNYNVRNGPGIDARVLLQLSGDGYDFDVDSISGEWMQVTVNRPARCAPPADGGGGEVLLGGPSSGGLAGGPGVGLPAATIEPETAEPEATRTRGWIKWRSADRGPWITQGNVCVTTVTSELGA